MDVILKSQKFVIAIFVVIVFNATFNIASFPEYFWDEGVYIDRAINFLKTSQVYQDPNYIDHPPLGWIIPSSVFAAINFPDSIIHLPTHNIQSQILLLFLIPRLVAVSYVILIAILVYKLSDRFYNNKSFATISLATFALIPALWPFRNLLLDPSMILFILLALFVIIPKNGRENNLASSYRLALSGTLFGCALLVKFSAIFFLPAVMLFAAQYGTGIIGRKMIMANYQSSTDINSLTIKQRIYRIIIWTLPIVGVMASWIFVMSIQHNLSHLISTQFWQIERTSTLPYGIALQILARASPVGLVFGLAGLAVLLKNKHSIATALLSIPYLGFLFRGGYVGFVQIIPLLPILSIYTGKPLYQFAQKIFHLKSSPELTYQNLVNLLLLVLLLSSITITIWFASFNAANAQKDAIEYLINTLPKNSVLVTDPGYGWIVKQYRPDIQVTNYFTLNFMKKIPDEIYIAESTTPIQRDPSLAQSQHIYEKSCDITTFRNEPPTYHPYSIIYNKQWDVIIRYFNAKGCM